MRINSLTKAFIALSFVSVLQPGHCAGDDIKIPMPDRSDGLNVISDNTAVLVRPQIRRSDDLLKRDALLNARLVMAENPQVKIVHTLFGCNQKPHIYKRVDVDHIQALGASSGQTLKLTEWNAIRDPQIPGYEETADSEGIFSEDPDHTRVGSMTIEGRYSNAGTLVLARTDEEVATVKAAMRAAKQKRNKATQPTRTKTRLKPSPTQSSEDTFSKLTKRRSF